MLNRLVFLICVCFIVCTIGCMDAMPKKGSSLERGVITTPPGGYTEMLQHDIEEAND